MTSTIFSVYDSQTVWANSNLFINVFVIEKLQTICWFSSTFVVITEKILLTNQQTVFVDFEGQTLLISDSKPVLLYRYLLFKEKKTINAKQSLSTYFTYDERHAQARASQYKSAKILLHLWRSQRWHVFGYVKM